MWNFVLTSLLIGSGATVLIDIWIYALNRIFGLPKTNWALAGRWFWRLPSGVVFHDDIAMVAPYQYERAVGWVCHYAIGVIYAGILISIVPDWLPAPTLFPTWVFGMLTILPGWFLLQPGMGLGFAASKRANAWQIRCLNIMSHRVFALGLYGIAMMIR
jgi:hypothetical protein